jgi:hypothetical protein
MSISLHPDTPEGRTLAAPPAADASAVPGPKGTKIRARLFAKYVALFVAVVGVALLSNGIFEVFFYYREHKAALIRIQHEQAEAAAAKIGQFIKEIESQLGWTTQLPWSAGSIEQRRFDALRLLRQVPAITELAQVDSTGKERLRVSRLVMDVLDSGLDLSKDPKFTEYTPALQTAMMQEIPALFQAIVFDRNASALELLTTRNTFVTKELAALYGLPTTGLSSTALTAATLPANGQRAGLLTTAAF